MQSKESSSSDNSQVRSGNKLHVASIASHAIYTWHPGLAAVEPRKADIYRADDALHQTAVIRFDLCASDRFSRSWICTIFRCERVTTITVRKRIARPVEFSEHVY